MKTVFNKPDRDELINRTHLINNKSVAHWGKMNVYQMTKHCNLWHRWMLGKDQPIYKQMFLGKIMGRLMLKLHTKDDSPLPKNTPTGKGLLTDEKTGDLDEEKRIVIALMADYADYANESFIHDFYGKMTRDQIGIFVYKHADHHLRQFGV